MYSGSSTMDNRSVDRIFWDAAQIASPAEREAFLKRACDNDVELRRRVEQLLEARSKADDFFKSPDATQANGSSEPVFKREGAVIGPCRSRTKGPRGSFLNLSLKSKVYA